MANQLLATVVTNNGSTYTQAFSTEEIWIQESTGDSDVNAIIWFSGNQIFPQQQFPVEETISELATLAGSGMIQATVKQINSNSQREFQGLFSSLSSAIGISTGTSGINSYILFNGNKYYAEETQSDLVDAANAGGDGSVPSYISDTLSSYGSNALAVTAIGVGKLYKSTTFTNDSPIILITV